MSGIVGRKARTEPLSDGHPNPGARLAFSLPALLGGLLLLTVACYANTLRAPFVFDDLAAVRDNPAIRRLFSADVFRTGRDTSVAGRPLVQASFALNHAVSGLDPWSYHAANICVHYVNACLLFALTCVFLRRRAGFEPFRARAVAAAGACAWAVHPLCTGAVTYTIMRTESLMALCFLATLAGFARAILPPETDSRRRTRWLIFAVGACAAGMACKETMAGAPLAVLLFDALFGARSPAAALRIRPRFYAGLFSTWLILGGLVAAVPRGKSVGFVPGGPGPFDYFLIQIEVIAHYLRLAVWPFPQSLDYEWRAIASVSQVLPEALLLLAVAGFGAVAWRHRAGKPATFCVAASALVLAPSSSFIPVFTSPAAEHRVYLPLAFGIATLAGYAAALVRRARPPRVAAIERAAVVVAGVLVAALAVATVARNRVYADVESVWMDVLKSQPHNVRAKVNLAQAFIARGGRIDAAERLLREALAKQPRHPVALYNLGTLLARSGRLDEGIATLEAAAAADPANADVLCNLGNALRAAARGPEAASRYREALALDPNHAHALFNAAALALDAGQPEEARPLAARLLAVRPDHPGARALASAAGVPAPPPLRR